MTRMHGVAVALVACGLWQLSAQEVSPETQFTSTAIDFGLVCADVEKSRQFYTQVVGLKEIGEFDVPAEFAKQTGLSNGLPFHVHMLAAGEGPQATKLKLMQFRQSPGARPDQSFIHSTYGIRYVTFSVKDVKAAVARAAQHGVKPIAQSPQALPAGFPEGIGLANLRDPDGNLVELVGAYTP